MDAQLLLDNFRQYISLTVEEAQQVLQYTTPRSFKRGEFIKVNSP